MTIIAAERVVLVRRWERASEWPLMAAVVVFLAVYAVPILHRVLESAARLVQFAELDYVGHFRGGHRCSVGPGRRVGALSNPALV
jgi:hypothetical protein